MIQLKESFIFLLLIYLSLVPVYSSASGKRERTELFGFWRNDDLKDSPASRDLLHNKLSDVKKRALDWLTIQRKGDHGWGSDTPQVILALSSALVDWPQKNDAEALLIAKELEIELLAKFLRYPDDPLPPARIAYYAIALNAICRDPRDYYGYNLIEILENHTSDSDYLGYPETYGFSLSSLVSCLGGSHIHRRQIHHLIQISRDDTRLHSVETRAVALLALKCVHSSRKIKGIHRVLDEGYAALGRMQRIDGSFGTLHTTAMVIQGLSWNESYQEYWNETSGILWLISKQNSDGSFEGEVLSTAESLLSISSLLHNNTGILNLKRNHCSTYFYTPIDSIIPQPLSTSTQSSISQTIVSENQKQDVKGPISSSENSIGSENGTQSNPSPQILENTTTIASPQIEIYSSSPLLTIVKYSIWIGPEPKTADKHNLTITVPANTSFFHVMQRAAELDPAFEFSSTVWPNGHYVHTISGHREQASSYNYWLLYRLPGDPDPGNPPPTTYVAEKGVDDLLVQNGDNYLFWFKKI